MVWKAQGSSPWSATKTIPYPFWAIEISQTHPSFEKRNTPTTRIGSSWCLIYNSFWDVLPTPQFQERPRKGELLSHWGETTPSFFSFSQILNSGSFQNQLSFEPCNAKTTAMEWSFNSLSLSFWWQTLTAGYNRTTCNVLVITKVTVTKHFKLWIASD